MRKHLFHLILICFSVSSAHSQWIKQDVKTNASLRGLSVVNEKVVWASGTGGTVIRTIDGGKTWNVVVVPGAEKLDFRDIEAFDANTAYILSIGNGDSSRIYKTTDGGTNWNLQFKNANPKAFFDAMACWDKNNCVAMSDPVDRKFVLIQTKDGGKNWTPMDTSRMPEAKEGEAAFAASGTCLITQGKNNLFLVTGGSHARVFRSSDRGATWAVAETPIVKGTSGSGIFSIAMRDAKNGVIVGGDYERTTQRSNTFAMTHDGGATWQPGATLNGYRSGTVYVDRDTIISVGTTGADVSYSRCLSWEQRGQEDLNAVAAFGKDNVWGVGPRGNLFSLRSNALTNAYAGLDPKEFDLGDLPPRVTNLELSHSEISSSCAGSNAKCSANRRIEVRVTAMQTERSSEEFVYTVSAGKIIGNGSNVEWDLSNVPPGKYTITSGLIVPYLRCTIWGVVGTTMTQSIVIE